MTTTEPGPTRPGPWRALLVPSAVSLCVHGALLALLLTVTVTVLAPERRPAGEPDAGAGVTLHTPRNSTTSSTPPPDRPASAPAHAASPQAPDPPADLRASLTRAHELASAMDATPPGSDAPRERAPARAAPGASDAPSDAPAAGRPTRVTPPGPAPAPRFAGVRGGAEPTVVYLIDTSGPMASSLRFVTAEAARSIERLDAAQRFEILAFAATTDGPPDLRRFPRAPGAQPATPVAKADAREWLEQLEPGGGNALAPALRAALAARGPRTVFVLARSIERTNDPGAADAQRALLEELDRLNPRRGRPPRRDATIVTIQFIEPDPTGLLPSIASAHAQRDTPAPGEDAPGHTVLTIEALLDRWARAEREARARTLLDASERTLAEVAIESVGVLFAGASAPPSDRDRVRSASDAAIAQLRDARAIGVAPDDDERLQTLHARARALAQAAQDRASVDLDAGARVRPGASGAPTSFERAAFELVRTIRDGAGERAIDEAAERFALAGEAPELHARDDSPAPSVVRAGWGVLREHLAPIAGERPRRWDVLERWARLHEASTGRPAPEALAPFAHESAPVHRSPTVALARVLALEAGDEQDAAGALLAQALAAHPNDPSVRALTADRLERSDPEAEPRRFAALFSAALAHDLRVPRAEAAALRRLAAHAEHGRAIEALEDARAFFAPHRATSGRESAREIREAAAALARAGVRERLRAMREQRAELEGWDAPARAKARAIADAWRAHDGGALLDADGLDLAHWAIVAAGVDALLAREPGAAAEDVRRALESGERAGDATARFRLTPERVRLELATRGSLAAREAARDAIAANPGSELDPTAVELWTLLLRMVRDDGAQAGERAAARAHVARLRAIDPALGGGVWGPRLANEGETR
ncbi:MAG: hypothetical protein EA378_07090 [Phycisphaerales bacterium]|nr:MAG: hypothetical protein EA378_07090 [Phycisphaerales bacterium]